MRYLTTLFALVFCSAVHAQQFPTKTVRFVSGVTPGSASDTMARILAEKLQAQYGHPVRVHSLSGESIAAPHQAPSTKPDSLCERPHCPACVARKPLASSLFSVIRCSLCSANQLPGA